MRLIYLSLSFLDDIFIFYFSIIALSTLKGNSLELHIKYHILKFYLIKMQILKFNLKYKFNTIITK